MALTYYSAPVEADNLSALVTPLTNVNFAAATGTVANAYISAGWRENPLLDDGWLPAHTSDDLSYRCAAATFTSNDTVSSITFSFYATCTGKSGFPTNGTFPTDAPVAATILSRPVGSVLVADWVVEPGGADVVPGSPTLNSPYAFSATCVPANTGPREFALIIRCISSFKVTGNPAAQMSWRFDRMVSTYLAEGPALIHASGGDWAGGFTAGAYPSENILYAPTPAFLRFPRAAPPVIESSKAYLKSVSADYESISLTWGIGTDDRDKYDWVCITKSGYGFPNFPNDGEKVIMANRGEITLTIIRDTKVARGHWYYYTLFLNLGGTWKSIKQTRCLVPVDYAHRDKFWEMLPEYYRWADDQRYASSNNSSLRRLFYTVGFEADLTRTMAERAEAIYSAEFAPMQLFSPLGQYNFGLSPSEALGDVRYRRLVANASWLVSLRGTYLGLEEFISTVTQYTTEVTAGRNYMLVNDDAEFGDSIGHWCRPSAAIAQRIGSNSVPNIPTARTFDLTLGVVDQDEIQAPTVAVANKVATYSLVIGRRALKISPRWQGGYPDGGAVTTPDSHMAVACGAGSFQVQTDVDQYRDAERDPTAFGIPIHGGNIYSLSFFSAREGYRPQVDVMGEQLQGAPDVEVVNDSSPLIFGFAWYDREASYNLLDTSTDTQGVIVDRTNNKAFSDAFGAGATTLGGTLVNPESQARSFSGYRQVVPLQVSFIAPTTEVAAAPKVWHQYFSSFTAPPNADFAVPVICYTATNISARYLAGVMVNEEGGSGVEIGYAPEDFFRLAESHLKEEGPPDHVVKILGPGS